ncbi:3',5'-cyclic-AMP phosphodiesterase [Aquicella lusitana]|uniref:Icc protein n=1 Tax=Aquicella lusitana TaxID=254246 RepID=A0A370G0D5_9COXI|nr:3',5'-cyclic-AMP phosphodiesterase [Aquicella lusitana]RDI37202.1 Icc protein [Aquicella lusitana]VVC74276.1 3',5'-cyclic adenosine monophosphate phosphodiesterase CpdA [Aquicella lusitana]
MAQAAFNIIQISDTHLFADSEGILLGVKTQASFKAVVDLVQREAGKIDLILLSGDLSQDGSKEAYIRLANFLKSVNVPIYCVPGNHDNVKVMAHVYPYETISNHRHIILKNWHIILLNSQKPGAVEGYLDPSQLNYLQHCLQTYPEHQALIVFHHQPVPVGSRWLDNLGLTNADAFWRIISSYPNVNTVFFGHVHQEFEQVVNKVHCYAAPSTCIQFKRNKDDFGLERLPPGYRWIKLFEDGHLETGVKRTAEYVGVFEEHAKGY